MKERVRLMKCQNKKKNVKRAVAGIIFLSVIAIILSAYGVTQMYASPENGCKIDVEIWRTFTKHS